MRTRNLTDLVHFSDDQPRRELLFDSTNVFAQVICLQGNQKLGPLADPVSEGIVTVLAGEVSAQAGRRRSRMKQWETALVPPAQELTLTNASTEPSVVLLILSPPPVRREGTTREA